MRSARCWTTLPVVILCLAAVTSAQTRLSTSMDYNNGQDGIMFDVQAAYGDLRITAIDCSLDVGTHVVEVWRVTDGTSLVGKETDPSAWTFCGSNTVTSSSPTYPTPLGIPLDIEVAAGQLMGLYVTATANFAVNYSTGSNFGGLRAQTPDLLLFEGVGKSYPFGSTFGSGVPGATSSRGFNGNIHYSLGSAGGAASISFGSGSLNVTGSVFDIRAKEPITIEGFALELVAGTWTFEVWTPRLGGDRAASIGDPSKWMRVGRVDSFTAPVAARYDLGFDLDVPLAQGETRAFYVTGLSPFVPLRVETSPANVGDLVAQDVSLDVLAGTPSSYFLGGFAAAPCAPACDIRYRRNLPSDSTTWTTQVLASTDGPNIGPGLFFDLAAAGDTVQVTDIDAIMQTGTHTVELYVVTDRTSHIGKETNPGLWTLVGSEVVNVPGPNTLVNVFDDLRIVLEAGGVQGCYITTTAGTSLDFSYSSAAQGVTYASNGHVELRGGSRANYPFMPTILNRGPDLQIVTRGNSTSPDSIFETFDLGAGIEPPPGWFSHLAAGNNFDDDGWRFDNPQPINPPAQAPISGQFAVVDTDLSGPSNAVDATLYSPRFDASVGNLTLSFDHFHRPLGSTISADVWDGSAWNNLFSTTLGTTNPQHENYDITAAAGGHAGARVRFRYVGDFDWHWAVDNVRIATVGTGQEPRPGLSVFDLNWSRELQGQPVASNLPGPYFAEGHTAVPAVFEFQGEPNQPVLLLQGLFNPNGWDFLSYGKLDIGIFYPMTASFGFIEQLAFGGDPGFINSLFVTSPAGALTLAFPLPPFTIGNNYNFQALILSSFVNSSLTNMVRLQVVN